MTHTTKDATGDLKSRVDKELLNPASAEDLESLQQSIALLRESARLANLGHAVWDEINNVYTYVSEEFARVFGYAVDEFVAEFTKLEKDLELVHPDDLDRYCAYLDAFDPAKTPDIGYRIIRGDGATRHIRQRYTNIFNESGNPTKSLITVQDITQHVEREVFLQRRNKLSDLLGRMISTASRDESSIANILTEVVRDVCTTTSWQIGHVCEVVGDSRLQPTKIWYVEDRREFSAFVAKTTNKLSQSSTGLPERVFQTGEAHWVPNVAKDEMFSRAPESESPIGAGYAIPVTVGGRITHILAFYSRTAQELDELLLSTMVGIGEQIGRVVERTNNSHRLLHQSTHDSLTGLYNGRMLDGDLEQLIEQNRPRVVLFLDLDRFKEVNDAYGHEVGGKLIKLVAHRLVGSVGQKDKVYRKGGDEFQVLLTEDGAVFNAED